MRDEKIEAISLATQAKMEAKNKLSRMQSADVSKLSDEERLKFEVQYNIAKAELWESEIALQRAIHS